MVEYLWIVALVLVIGGIAMLAYRERKNLKNWLLYAVAAAEKALGSGTGELKLRQVYDAFLVKFPITSKFMSFETFKTLVDDALNTLEELIQGNEKVDAYIKGE